MVSWSLRDISEAVEERSALDTSAARRADLDERLRVCVDLLRKMLPADHWYVQLAHSIVNGGTRAGVILDNFAAERPEAILPALEIIERGADEVRLADDTHHDDGRPLGSRSGTKDEARKMALFSPRDWFKTFITVSSEEIEVSAAGLPQKVVKPFDMGGLDARSVYQEQCYGPFLDRWATDDPHVPETQLTVRRGLVVRKQHQRTGLHYLARAKPRKVGSTTWGKKFSVLCGSNIDNWVTLLHFPGAADAKLHLRDVADDLRRLHALWPHIYPPLTIENYTEGILECANGSTWVTRHGDTSGGGTTKVGHTGFNLVILSEAGKYERKGGAKAWNDINQAILPAVYPSSRNVIIWEGTNDEQAHELNRIATLSHVDFQFFGWTCLWSNKADRVSSVDQQESPAGTYADFDIGEDGEPVPVPERLYAAKYGLTPEQVGWRRLQIDKLGELMLVHLEHPISYEESLGLVSGGFFMKMQEARSPDRIGSLVWSDFGLSSSVQTVRNKVSFVESARGGWHFWDLPPLAGDGDVYYGVGGDFADGMSNSDYAPLAVIRINDARVCAVRRTRIAPEDAADEMAKAVSFYGWQRTYVIGELNGPGKVALGAWEKYHHALNYTQVRRTRGFAEDREVVWFLQTPSTREPTLIAFRRAYHNNEIRIEDERFEWDAEGFVKNKAGKYCAMTVKSQRTGERFMDDMVMLMALLWELACWMRQRGMGAEVEVKSQKTRVDKTMITSMTPRLQRIIKKHMEIRR